MRINPARRPLALIIPALLVGLLVLASVSLAQDGGDDPPTPVISGEPVVGATLVASEAAIYKWQRCDPGVNPCGSDGGQNGSGWVHLTVAESDPASYTLTAADLGMMIRVLAKDTNLGTKFAASDPVGPIVAGEEPPPPPPPPTPEFLQTGNLDPVSGSVLALVPGSQEWTEITELTQVPMGTKVDVGDGRVDLTTERKTQGFLQTIELWGGAFVVNQRPKGVTVLRLRHGRATQGEAVHARHRKRRLWGRGRCRCRHRGRHSSGTARGTWWVTVETPRGTVTRVKEGVVAVRDFSTRKRILVEAGERYLARR
ncbi:MAG TPA: hypothetical protein VK919_12505 [Solirubrobacterales bacterium]|nr:hypothetical protein [Solirubrobacterales bacterium]